VNITAIADDIAIAARDRIASHGLSGGLVSVIDHPHRAALRRLLDTDQEGVLLKELHRALRPVAEEHKFVDIHVWTEGPGTVSLLHENLLSPLG
jgi:hypothetical protein